MYENTLEVLNRYGQRVIDLYRSNLKNNGHNATGNLASTATFTVETSSGDICVTIHLEDYYRYVEEGRRPGKFPPVDAILSWIEAKNIMPREINGKLLVHMVNICPYRCLRFQSYIPRRLWRSCVH